MTRAIGSGAAFLLGVRAAACTAFFATGCTSAAFFTTGTFFATAFLAAGVFAGACFAAVKLSPDAAALLVRALSSLGRPAAIYLDRSDLLTLPALVIAYWIGRDELRRIPLGKPAAIHRLRRPAHPALIDSHIAGANTRELADAIDAWDVPRIDALLAA